MFQFLTIVRSDGGDDVERGQEDSIKIMITPTGSLLKNYENYKRKKVINFFLPTSFLLKNNIRVIKKIIPTGSQI